MDPLTQGVVGAIAAQQPAKQQHLVLATLLGVLSGMAPDLDVLIRSSTDPLLALEFHRQFTHSLFFIPLGGFICAAIFFTLFARRRGLTFLQTYLFCTLGYATHGLLDACTTYGTQLFWPLSDHRVAWNTISIIDPLYTFPLLFLVILAAKLKKKLFAYCAVFWVVFYSTLGIFQRERAEAIGWELAHQRGHAPEVVEAKPSFANVLVWKIIYTTEDEYVIDAVKIGLSSRVYRGKQIAKLNLKKDFPWLDENSQQARDIERFRWFSNGYIALSPHSPNLIIDIRYSMIPNEIKGLWGIKIDPLANAKQHVDYVFDRKRDGSSFGKLWSMIIDG